MACETNKCAYADFPKRLSNLQTMIESSGINKDETRCNDIPFGKFDKQMSFTKF